MERETLKELNEIRKYLEISKEEFKNILLLAHKYQKENVKYINEELLYEIIVEALNNMDYQSNNFENMVQAKTTQQVFNRALDNLGYQKVKKYKRTRRILWQKM